MNSCHNDMEVNKKFKLKFLNQILSDTINLKLINSKKTLISNYTKLEPLNTIKVEGDTSNISKMIFYKISVAKRLSEVLNESDTIFLKSQLKSNKDLDILELSKFGFNTIDIKNSYKNKASFEELLQLYATIRNENIRNGLPEDYGFFFITKPIFNKKLDKAFIRVQHKEFQAPVNEYIITKVKGKWSKKELISG